MVATTAELRRSLVATSGLSDSGPARGGRLEVQLPVDTGGDDGDGVRGLDRWAAATPTTSNGSTLTATRAYKFARDYNGIAPNPTRSRRGMANRCPARRLRRPVLAGGVVGARASRQAPWSSYDTPARVSASTTSTSARSGGPAKPYPRPSWCAGNWQGVPKVEVVVGLVAGEGGGTVLGHNHPGQGRPSGSAAEIVSTPVV